jgi:phosphate transport system substrate-binding protein
MKAIFVIVLLVCVVCSSGTYAQESVDPYAGLWARIDGSTATIPLSEAILMNRLNLDPVQASGRMIHSNTYSAYQALMAGEKDLIFVPLPEPGELEVIAHDLSENGGEPYQIPELTYHQIVKEGLVFFTNAANPITGLTREQLQGIYSGQVKNWREVGGNDVAIMPFQRNHDSGSQTAFLQLLMKDVKPYPAPTVLTIGYMGLLMETIAAYENRESAIGYSMHYYATRMYGKENLHMLAVDGVVPSTKSIAEETYPLVTGYYAVYRSDLPENHPARQLTAWLLSDEGQEVMKKANYIPLGIAQ